MATRIKELTGLSAKQFDQLTARVAASFPGFGGEKPKDGNNPLTHWMHGQEAQFAMGVKVREVVAATLVAYRELKPRKR